MQKNEHVDVIRSLQELFAILSAAEVTLGDVRRAIQFHGSALVESYPPISLTAREWQILSAVCGGLRNAEIAQELGITTHTVKAHIGQIFDKCGVFSRLELATRYGQLPGLDKRTADNQEVLKNGN